MYRNVVLFPGQRLISDSGRELETHAFAEWDDAIYAGESGVAYTEADYRRMPLAQRKLLHKVAYANVVDEAGNTVRREYRDPTDQPENPHLAWYIDRVGNEISGDAATWSDQGIFHLSTGKEITPEEYATLSPDEQEDYAELRYCYVAGDYGVGQRLYAEKDGTRLATLACYEPALESLSPLDIAPENDQADAATKHEYIESPTVCEFCETR